MFRTGCTTRKILVKALLENILVSIQNIFSACQPITYMTPPVTARHPTTRIRDQLYYLPEYKPGQSFTNVYNHSISSQKPDYYGSPVPSQPANQSPAIWSRDLYPPITGQHNIEDDSGFESLVTNVSDSGDQHFPTFPN